jgi:hypothetical protein
MKDSIWFLLVACMLTGCDQPDSRSAQSQKAPGTFTHSPNVIRSLELIDDADLAIRNEMDSGYQEMSGRRYDRAVARFSKAESMFILENPNFLPWIGKAEALCRQGKREEGRYYVANFRCALDIISGDRKCNDMEAGYAVLRPGLGAISLCHQSFCAAEIVRPQYEDISRSDQPSDEHAGLLDLTEKVDAICGR